MEPIEIITTTSNRPRPSIDCIGRGNNKQSCIYWNINDEFRKYVIKEESKLEIITCKEVKKSCPIECKKTTYTLNESWVIINANLTEVISYGKNSIRSASTPKNIVYESNYQ